MRRLYKFGLVLAILVFLVSCDRIVKSIAERTLASTPPFSLLGGVVRVEYAENAGAMLSLGADLPASLRLYLFGFFVLGVLIATLVFAFKRPGLDWPRLAALSFVAAGGIGNLLDRVFNHGVVVDFVSIGVGPLRTGIFNVADVAIMGGMAALILLTGRGK